MKGILFHYVQCNLEVPEILRKFANFPPIFKNTLIRKNDMENLMKTYAEEQGIRFQRRKFWYQASHFKTDLLSLFCCCSTCNWGLFLQNTPICWVHSNETLQQLCTVSTVSSGRKNKRWPESKRQCSSRDNKAPGQQLLRLPDYGP